MAGNGLMKFDYAIANECVAQFNTLQQQALDLVAAFKANADKATAPWEGQADNAFVQETDSCMTKLRFTPQMIDECAKALQFAITAFSEAEATIAQNTASTVVSDTGA
jgi:uncharacterized protein YukE